MRNSAQLRETDGPPNRLYRYRVASETMLRPILEENVLYFASPKRFNDPHDCRVPAVFFESVDDIRVYYDRLLRENCPTMQTHERYDRIEQLIRDRGWEKVAAQIQKEIDNAGMLCLTENCDNARMWDGHAENGRGVCLEFLAWDDAGLTFFGLHSFNITYSDSREYNLLGDPWEQAKTIVLTKSLEWSYENEWRIVLRNRLGQRTVGNILFPPEFLTRLIFGEDVDEVTKVAVRKWIRAGRCRPALYQVQSISPVFSMTQID